MKRIPVVSFTQFIVQSSPIISILATISEMERSPSKERQLEGIRLAKARHAYTGQKSVTNEDVHSFLSKPKNRKALEYIKRGMSHTEAANYQGTY